MTMRDFTWYQCPCGHKGAVVVSENDQPYSKMWERTSLRDLSGSAEQPVCPKCKTQLAHAHIVQG